MRTKKDKKFFYILSDKIEQDILPNGQKKLEILSSVYNLVIDIITRSFMSRIVPINVIYAADNCQQRFY